MVDAPAAYDFVAPPLIRFGAGRIDEIGGLVAILGRKAWIVGGGRSLERSGARSRIDASLAAANVASIVINTSGGEPTVDHLVAALEAVRHEDRDGVVVVAVGGGSTIDLAKALSAIVTNMPAGPMTAGDLDGIVIDHLEGVGRNLPLRNWPLPMVAVPTTAGTGAEATRNAVLSCPRRRFKKSMRSVMMVPRAALVDPDLTASCDAGTITASGLDCITQLVESFVCRFSRPLPRSLVLESLPRAIDALPILLASRAPHDDDARAAARAAMSHAALLSGMALTNAGLGMAHGVAAALGIACGTPHGTACAFMLPVAVRVNREVARHDFAILERAIDPGAPADDEAAADAFADRIEGLCSAAGVPRRLSELGVSVDQLDWLAENSGGASMRGNPVQLPTAHLREVLARVL